MCLYKDRLNNNLIIEKQIKKINNYEFEEDKYTGFKENSYTDKFIKKLRDFGIEVHYDLGKKDYSGFIDHSEEWINTVDIILNNNELFKKFLFNESSCVLTSNDNAGDFNNFALYERNSNFIIYNK